MGKLCCSHNLFQFCDKRQGELNESRRYITRWVIKQGEKSHRDWNVQHRLQFYRKFLDIDRYTYTKEWSVYERNIYTTLCCENVVEKQKKNEEIVSV